MIRVMQITGYYEGKDKFNNEQYVLDGVGFDKASNYHGNPMKRVYLKKHIFKIDDSCIQKVLYAEYNERGNVVKCEVK